ncbi:leucine-rich repeat domain-containing protein [Anaerostipes hadrus]|uniref:leucine-rich repeat domain-containing protein n=1 Tax=Anaerostipes hadrus TaxID=649756 RepID=UPI001FD786F3|nr:leucine-rich repeat domain-containing protein [Anaerostipes hadrus]
MAVFVFTVKTIGIRSFYGTKISKITVPSKTKTIGQGAFGSCKSLKTIVMPGDFKLKLEEDTDDKLWYVTNDQSAVDTITFNTKLKLANVSYLSANNLVVAKNDPSYQSIEGVIYTKDGKGIVRVPQKRTELKIKEGCTEFNMQSVLYNSTDSEGDEFNNCSKLKKIVIPSSVKSINKIKYKTDRADACDMHVDTIEIAPKDFDANSLYALGSSLGKNITIESLMKLLPDQITYKDHMYITKDHGLLKYDGKDANVEIPEEITWIAPEVFYRNETLKNVKLPSKITTIEENTFYGCSELEAVIIPDQVTMIGKSAFDECTVLKSVTFGKSLKVIKDQAFASVNIRNFTIPSGIQKIETGAFAGINQIGTVTFEGSTKYVATDAFMNSTGIKLVYKKGIKEAQTELSYDYIIARKNGNNKVRTTWQPVSGANGYQLKFSMDKKFKKVLKTVTVKKNVTNATTYVKNKKKNLYIKVRPYQTINKKNVYGRWSYLQL